MKVSMLHYSNSIIDFGRLFGMQVSEINTLNQLRARGVDATLYTRQFLGCHENIKEVEYDECNKYLFDAPFYTRFVQESAGSDVLQGNATPLLAAFRPERTLIRINGHFEFPMAAHAKVQNCYTRASYLFVSEYMRREYLKKYSFFERSRCHVLHNAVDCTADRKKAFGAKIKLVFASRWIAQKGLHVMLDAIRMLQKTRHDFEVHVAGGLHTTKRVDEQALALESAIAAEFARHSCIHLVGYLPPVKMLKFFEEMDVLLFPSIWGEPFSSMPLQAAMARVPTIGFDDGSLAEAVEHRRTGILIKKSRYRMINARRLFSALNQLLDERNLIQQMGDEARRRAVEKFNWDRHIAGLCAIYDKVLSGR